MRLPFFQRPASARPPSGGVASRPKAAPSRGGLSFSIHFRLFLRTLCRFFRRRGRVLLGGLALLCLTGLLGGSLVLTVSLGMVGVTSPHVLTPEAACEVLADEAFDCILVLGAGVRTDGTPSDMLHDRVTTACGLYDPAHATPILMSGDHSPNPAFPGGDYNEVGVMKELAVSLGIPSEEIFLDHDGNSTYESLYRARHMFGARRVLIVTQGYHLHRALFIARELGMEAVGVAADLRPYRKQTTYDLREHLARFQDFFVAAADTPVAVGPAVDLTGDGNLT